MLQIFSLFCFVYDFKELLYLCNQMSDWDGFESKCSILNGQVVNIEKLKLKIADISLIVSQLSCMNQ